MPFVDRDLAGEDGRAAAVTILEDLVEIVTGAGVEGFKAPIIEDQQLNPGQAAQDPSIASVAACQGEVGEQLGDTLIEHRAIVAAGLVTESAGQPTLADAGRAREILPKNSRSKFSFTTPTTRARVNASA
jgi:hypothetical protein